MAHLRVLLVVVCAGCAVPTSTDAGQGDPFDAPGPFAVGSTHTTITRADAGRVLPVELWFPATEAARAEAVAGFPVEAFELEPRRTQLAGWIQQAPAVCIPRLAHSARDATPTDAGSFPLIVLSHCTGCFRFSLHTLAERLASHGFVVAAPDHVDNTRFDNTENVTDAFLAVRAADLASVLDALLDAQSSETPASLRGRLDATRVGVMGHSYGAVTAGKLVEFDARPRAGFLIAAPVDSPFLNHGSTPQVHRPLSWLLALEDNSISYLGNQFIRDNFVQTPRPAWLLEVENAGHWSFSDIAGLGGDYLPGCGTGLRDPDGGAFTYLDNDVARAIAARAVTAWAKTVLLDDADAGATLSTATPPDLVHVRQR